MGTVQEFLLSLILFYLALFTLPGFLSSVLALFILQFILIKVVCWRDPDIIGILGARDAIFLTDRFNFFKKNKPDIFITGSVVLEGKVSLNSLRTWLQKNLVELRDADGSLKYPQLQQSQLKKFGYWWWKWDKEFNINNHVRYTQN